jgi:hypothetical protein
MMKSDSRGVDRHDLGCCFNKDSLGSERGTVILAPGLKLSTDAFCPVSVDVLNEIFQYLAFYCGIDHWC